MRGADGIGACLCRSGSAARIFPPSRRSISRAKARRADASSRRASSRRSTSRCGFRFSCPNCDAWLVDHRFRRQLVCHHCGFYTPRPPSCPKCLKPDSFVACGPGVERLDEEAAALFPHARIMVLSSDLMATAERMREELKEIAEGHVDIIIGTQLVAKGHHFPKLNLVGIVDADLGLSNGDPRAAERTFQLLHQVAGRAGRETGRGYGFLQTHQPNHPVMRALIAGDREAFYATEIAARERALYPPFGRLASLVISGPDRPSAEGFARRLVGAALPDQAVRVLGPAEAPIAVVRGRHRFRLLVKAARGFDLSGYLRGWLAGAPKAGAGVKLEVDVDPMSFL
jgi:primosomal protein N' (replication factor Y) (superfamily II helicase)